MDGVTFSKSLEEVYCEVIHWTKNSFRIPQRNVAFVSELARLFGSYVVGSAMESVALMAATVFPILVLQTPHRKPKSKELSSCLDRRLKSWKDGDLSSLIKEGRTLQQRLPKVQTTHDEKKLARNFSNLMFKEKYMLL